MADWGAGHVTYTAYVHDFCLVQTPAVGRFFYVPLLTSCCLD